MLRKDKKMQDLIEMVENEPRVSHRVIAEQTGNQAKNVLELITKNKEDFEDFGGCPFQTETLRTAGGRQKVKICYLNEPQATLLMTYLRNNEIVKAFKKALVKAFYELKEQQKHPELVPPHETCGKIYHHEQVVNPNDEKIRSAIFLAYGGKCYYTKKKLHKRNFEIDHVYPVAKGGRDTLSNLVLCHPLYNEQKADNIPVELKQIQLDILQNYTDIVIEIYNKQNEISIAHKKLQFGNAILKPGNMQELDNRFGRETVNQYIADMIGMDYDPENSKDKRTYDHFLDRDMTYDEFVSTMHSLGYKGRMKDFFHEIGMNERSAVQTWKKKGVIPPLAKHYVLSKFEK
jgi:hypothetical protein